MDKRAIRSVMLKKYVQETVRKCYMQGQRPSLMDLFAKSKEWTRVYEESDVDSSFFVVILARMAEQMTCDEFNTFWFHLSDCIYPEDNDIDPGEIEDNI